MVRLKELDWIGYSLHTSTLLLFTLACIASGPSWEWNSRSTRNTWLLFACMLLAYIAQQALSFGTSRDRRLLLPWFTLLLPRRGGNRRTVFLAGVCTACAGAAVGLVVYYTPIYFVLMRVHSTLDATSRLLPFLAAFLAAALLSGALLARLRAYRLVFMVGAACLAVGSGLLHAITPDTDERAIKAYEAFVGAGAGVLWHLAAPVLCALQHQQQQPEPEPERHLLLDHATLQSAAQLGGLAAARAIAAVLYHGVGGRLLRAAIADAAYSDADVRELLLGIRASAIMTETNPDTLVLVYEIVVQATARCFSVLVVAGVAAFVAACCLRGDEPDFFRSRDRNRNRKRSKTLEEPCSPPPG
ncbi:hypothetical protein SLS62_002035 [Diatrype stigma]|uniref:Uncharacterized protein n=1 Tax=Diatrype stigma TaxID=117547 RepID=A0AAN9YVF6_9PEZI